MQIQVNDIKCFISHAWSGGGHEFAIKIAEELCKNGIGVWLDENEILGGEIPDSEMIKGVRSECNVFIFVLSPESTKSSKCAQELNEALRQRDQKGLQIIPILFKSCDIPNTINNLLYIDFRNIALFQFSIRKLIKSIKELALTQISISLLIEGTNEERYLAAQFLASKRISDILPILKSRFTKENISLIRYEIVKAMNCKDKTDLQNLLTEFKENEQDHFVLLGIEERLQEISFNPP